jgi:hypothetical protein
MSEALTVIDVPSVLPKGVTRRQWRLAALLPRCESAAEAMRQAGFATATINGNSGRQIALAGVRRATEELQRRQADRARGLASIGKQALATVTKDLQELEPRERIAAGFKAWELASALGENVQETGSASAWQIRLRRAMQLAYRFGAARQRQTQDVVVSPPPRLRQPK